MEARARWGTADGRWRSRAPWPTPTATPTSPAQLYFSSGSGSPQQLTHLDQDVLGGKQIAPVERLELKSRDGLSVEAFLTRPTNLGATPAPTPCPWW